MKGSRDSEEFVRLMTEHQGRLFAYILSLLGDPDAANDVLQETNVVLWRDNKEFRLGTNFKAWAFRVAHFQVMAWRQRQIRDRLVFEDDLLEAVAFAARDMDETFDARQKLLQGCLEKLAPNHREQGFISVIRRGNRARYEHHHRPHARSTAGETGVWILFVLCLSRRHGLVKT